MIATGTDNTGMWARRTTRSAVEPRKARLEYSLALEIENDDIHYIVIGESQESASGYLDHAD